MSGSEAHNRAFWAQGTELDFYDTQQLLRVEALLLLRHREAFCGRVLDVGAGTGRVGAYLAELATELHVTDIAQAMLDRCVRNVPAAVPHRLDLLEIGQLGTGRFDAVLAGNNVIDILEDANRHRFLDLAHDALAPGGLLVFSSHNRGAEADIRPPWRLRYEGPRKLLRDVRHMRRATANHRRLAPREVDAPDHAIRNDLAHDYALLHYYIDRDAQQAQLAAHGLELVECLDLDGRPVGPGDRAPHCHELHYVARRPAQGR